MLVSFFCAKVLLEADMVIVFCSQCLVSLCFSSGVRANAQQPKLYFGVTLILIFAEAIGLYGKWNICRRNLRLVNSAALKRGAASWIPLLVPCLLFLYCRLNYCAGHCHA